MTSLPSTGKPLEPDFIYITRAALDTMQQEALRAQASGTKQRETGGILFGGHINAEQEHYDLLIVAATTPGATPLQIPDALAPDAPYAQQQVATLHTTYPHLRYLGIWHTPTTAPPGNSVDAMGIARASLLNPGNAVEELVSVWVEPQPDGQVAFHYMYMSRLMAEQNRPFASIPLDRVFLIEDNERMVVAERAPGWAAAGIAAASSTPERMEEELRLLTMRGYQVRMRQQDQAYSFAVKDARLPDTTLYLIAQPGYPVVPPTVLAVQNGQRIPINDAAIQSRWATDYEHLALADVADEVLQQFLVPPTATTRVAAIPARPQAAPTPASQPPARPMQNEWLWLAAAGTVLGVIVLALLGYMFWNRGMDAATYAGIWRQVDAVLNQPSPGEAELRQTIQQLEQIRRNDPSGRVFQRNADVLPTLTRAHVLLGNFYMQQQPPNLDAADTSYTAALGITSNDPNALAGRRRVNEERAARAADEALQRTAAEIWQQVAGTSNLEERVRLIEVLQLRGVEADPAGVPANVRLHQARMDLARQQLGSQNYLTARTTADSARNNAPNDAARQEATDLLAQIYLAEGQSELRAGRFPPARAAFNAVTLLLPPPATNLVDQARQGLAQVAEAEQRLNNQQRIELGWQSYDAAMARQDWNAAIVALDSIMEVTGPTPELVDFPSPPYNPRTYNVAEVQAQARLLEAERLQRAGNLSAARAHITAIVNSQGRVTDATRQAATFALTQLDQAEQLWAQANAGQAAGNWPQMRDALLQLSAMSGFGLEARNPQGGITVGSLLALANSNIINLTTTPAPPPATSVPATTLPTTPVAASPAPDQPTPTASTRPPTALPLPTRSPTLPPGASPTATVATPTATTAPPTATSTSTTTPIPPTLTSSPTATLSPTVTLAPPTSTTAPAAASPTATAPAPAEVSAAETTLQPYIYTSGLFSVNVPGDWLIEDQSGPGQAQVIFTAPDGLYGLSVYVETAPEGTTPADLPTLVSDFVQRTFGSNPGFTVTGAATAQADGSVVLPFTYTGAAGNPLVGEIIARLDNDKLSLLVALSQGDQTAETNVLDAVLSSYTVNPDISLP